MTKTENPINQEREVLEALIWECTEWRGGHETVDKILAAVDRYASAKAEFLRTSDNGRVVVSTVHPVSVESVTVEVGEVTEVREDRVLEASSPLVVIDVDPSSGKNCKACGDWKPFEEYTRDRTRSDGHLSRCKRCVKEKRVIPRA